MKNIIIWSLELLLAVFAGFGTISAAERGYANRYRKLRKQRNVGLLPRIAAALAVLIVSIVIAAFAPDTPGVSAVIMLLVTAVWLAAELVMLVHEVNLLGTGLLASAAHIIAMAVYAYGGEMTLWPWWYLICLLAELILLAVMFLAVLLYRGMRKHSEEFREERAQRKAEAEAKKAARKEQRQIDREVDEEEAEDDQHRFWAIASVILVVLAIVAMVFLEVKFDFLPPYK